METPAPGVRLVVIDNDASNLTLIAKALEDLNIEVCSATGAVEGGELLLRKKPQIVVLELMLPGVGGMELLERVLEVDPGTTVMLMSAQYSTGSAVEAIQKGAYDYLNKPLDAAAFRQKIEKWLTDARLRQRTWSLDRELLGAYQFQGMVGRSPLMLDVFSRIQRVAPHFRTALVSGETGTGKELVARALHRLGPASGGPFVACNCSAIVETLLESELFGHVRGAFTGAAQDKVGMVESAQGGTLFLDEIGDMPLEAQARLLRVLQNQEVQRVGSPAVRRVDIRVVAATNRPLRSLVAQQRFRDDLYYRLSMIEIELPPLEQRKEDLPLLERHYIETFAAQYRRPIRGISPGLAGALCLAGQRARTRKCVGLCLHDGRERIYRPARFTRAPAPPGESSRRRSTADSGPGGTAACAARAGAAGGKPAAHSRGAGHQPRHALPPAGRE